MSELLAPPLIKPSNKSVIALEELPPTKLGMVTCIFLFRFSGISAVGRDTDSLTSPGDI